MIQTPEICNETLQKPEKPQKPMKMTANQIAIVALTEQGVSQRKIAQTLGCSSGYPSIVQNQFKAKYSLSDSKIVKAAHRVVKNILAGEPREEERTTVNKAGEVVQYIDKVYPPHTVMKATAEMVYDRFEPKQQDTPVLQGNSFTQININLPDIPNIPINITLPNTP